jgi:hypothetical protein
MHKPLLLLLALYGLGDDSFEVRQASERYLAASGYVVVPLNRMAPRLTSDLQTKKTLKKLERRYYGAWGAKLDRGDWREFPSLVVLCQSCHVEFDLGTKLAPIKPKFFQWVNDDDEAASDVLLPLVSYYQRRVRGTTGWPPGAYSNVATLELVKDLRSWGAPAWAGKAVVAYLHWRTTYLERRYKVRDATYSRR